MGLRSAISLTVSQTNFPMTQPAPVQFLSSIQRRVCLNEAEPRLIEDMTAFVEGLAPSTGWRHDELDDNADAHLRSMLLGRSVTVPVVDGRPDLGDWQSILFVACDGP